MNHNLHMTTIKGNPMPAVATAATTTGAVPANNGSNNSLPAAASPTQAHSSNIYQQQQQHQQQQHMRQQQQMSAYAQNQYRFMHPTMQHHPRHHQLPPHGFPYNFQPGPRHFYHNNNYHHHHQQHHHQQMMNARAAMLPPPCSSNGQPVTPPSSPTHVGFAAYHQHQHQQQQHHQSVFSGTWTNQSYMAGNQQQQQQNLAQKSQNTKMQQKAATNFCSSSPKIKAEKDSAVASTEAQENKENFNKKNQQKIKEIKGQQEGKSKPILNQQNLNETSDTTSDKSSSSNGKTKRSDSKSSVKSIIELKFSKSSRNRDQQQQQQKKKNDTMQRNCSKASHSSSSNKSQQNHNSNNNKHDSSDSGLSTMASATSNAAIAAAAKQRKSRSSSKRQDGQSSSSVSGINSNGQKHHRGASAAAATSSFTVNDWLQNDLYCYERRYLSTCVEDNLISRHNPAHRNSTSSEAAGSDDLNSSSSNEDLSSHYIVQSKSNKKQTKSRQKRQQKRKQQQQQENNAAGNEIIIVAVDEQPMDVDDELKENQKPAASKQKTNLRKQCTKAAAIKAALNGNSSGGVKLLAKCSGANILSTSASNSSVCSSLSSASSTTSISSSSTSSATSSPAHSANSSPTASPTAAKRNAEHMKKLGQTLAAPLRQFAKLNLGEQEFIQQMRRYIIDPSLLRVYGFPVESVHHEGCVEIYKCLPKHLAEEAITKDNQRHHRHFYGRKKSTNVINEYDGLGHCSQSHQWYLNSSVDSGHGSGDSSPRFTDSDSSEMGEDETTCSSSSNAGAPIMAFYTPDGVYQIFSEYDNSVEKQCVRCSKMFQVSSDGEYMSYDSCTYHWGKQSNVYNGKCYVNIYSCCQSEETTEGCTQHPLHVWNGAVVGINGPYADFKHTQQRQSHTKQRKQKIYAIDCEMSYTGLGLEVTKVTVVGYDGSLVYEHFVRPRADIIDYNTRFSGITEADLAHNSNNSIKTFEQMQADLLEIIDADTILIGHGLDNDLRVLHMVHKTIVDTSLIFGHSTGYPYRRSLKNLTKSFLKRDIQCGDMGHSSFEDSRACLELMMWKVRKDLRHWSYQ